MLVPDQTTTATTGTEDTEQHRVPGAERVKIQITCTYLLKISTSNGPVFYLAEIHISVVIAVVSLKQQHREVAFRISDTM